MALKPEDRAAAEAFYSLVLEGTDPWEAVHMVHEEPEELTVTSKARELLRNSQRLFEDLGLQEVPLLLVLNKGKGAIEASQRGKAP